MGLVGNFEMHFFTKDIIFEEISLSPFKQNKNQEKIFNIEKVTAVQKKREKKHVFFSFLSRAGETALSLLHYCR